MYTDVVSKYMSNYKHIYLYEGNRDGGKGGWEGGVNEIIKDQILDATRPDGRRKHVVNTRHRWKRKLYLIRV